MAQPHEVPFSTQLALTRLDESTFETTTKPQRMGNPLPIAYGGYALAVACKAAALTVPSNYHLYSMQGHFLGPASTDHQLRARTRILRQTRVFATRQVEVSQTLSDGSTRICLVALADFQTPEPATLLTYSPSPKQPYTPWHACPTQHSVQETLVKSGKVSEKDMQVFQKTFSLTKHLFDQRPCPEGIFAQNLQGMAKNLPHSQDHVPLPDRTTAEWFRSRETFPTTNPIDNIVALTWFLDAALSFTPLAFSHLWFEDVEAVSSLDFSLRVFTNKVDLQKWHLRELRTPTGGVGRSFGETWVWDEGGRAVACMSQQSILRPKKGEGQGVGRGEEKGKL
ncbi:hypothetical protein NX059_007775 [Plenodomus lindquistii]|nr:hypothetical protein NX059_007775 [Plenodomus lindquistii]